jgi:hypothetical protein
MTEKELLYVEDVLEQSKQLEDVTNFYIGQVSEEVEDTLNEVMDTANKQFKRIYNLL